MSELEAIEGVNEVVAVPARVGHHRRHATVVSSRRRRRRWSKVADIAVEEGDIEDLAEARRHDRRGRHRRRRHPGVGGTVTVKDSRGKDVDLEVVAVLEPSRTPRRPAASSTPRPSTLVGDVAPTVAFIDVASGAQSKTKEAIEELADLRPDITAQEGNALGKLIGSVFDFMIKAVTGLLLMSVVIALIGIINTMSLSILERRRELGLLRIIGMTDKRVQRMVRLESVLISLLGTVGGLVLGLVVWLVLLLSINRDSHATVAPCIPWIELIVILVLGVLLGVLAALLPARRSTKLEVLDAISAT